MNMNEWQNRGKGQSLHRILMDKRISIRNRMKQNSHLTPQIKINAQSDVEFTVKGQSDELLEDNTEEFLYDLRMEK